VAPDRNTRIVAARRRSREEELCENSALLGRSLRPWSAHGSLAQTAVADAPLQETLEINRTRTIPASAGTCPFPIVRHVEGTYHIVTFYDSDGNVERTKFFVSRYSITDTNPANGRTETERSRSRSPGTMAISRPRARV
jgi:hypothetical protein